MGLSEKKNSDQSPPFKRLEFVGRRILAGLYRLLGRDWPWIMAVLLTAFVAAWPAMSQPGLLNTRGGGDSPFLLQRVHQLTAALADGHFPVRWMPDANYGYGYPFYHFYAPLSIYIAAAFRFLGFSFVRAIHLAQLAGFIVAGLGMFYLGRSWLRSRWSGLLSAAAYTFAPFHMVNVYVRGDSLAEFWAMAFYPWVLLAADSLIGALQDSPADPTGQRPPALRRFGRPLALFALAYAALILSHNISALIFSPFLLLYLVVRLWQSPAGRRRGWAGEWKGQESPNSDRINYPGDRRIRSLFAPFFALILAFALAAWFFVPALAEQASAQLGPVTEGYFHFSNHFRGLDLVQSGLIFDYNPDGGVAFRLGLVQLGLALAGAAVWITSRGRTADGRSWAVVLLCALIAVFMVTPLSRTLWEHLPLLPFTQFPWRFLSVVSFFVAGTAGGLVLATGRPAARAGIALLGSLVLIAAGLLGLRTDHLILTDADVTAGRLAQYEWFTGNIGTTVSAEYLTPEALPRPWTSAWLNAGGRDRVVATVGEILAGAVEREATSQTWHLTAGEGGATAIFPTLYWSGWRATLDGRPGVLRASPASGLMTLDVPEGEHVVALQLGRTPIRLAAELVSLAALVITLALFLYGGRSEAPGGGVAEQGSATTPHRSYLPRRALYLYLSFVFLSIVALAIFWRDDPRELSTGDLTWDFAQMGYLHHAPGGVGFTDGSRLYEYGYSSDAIVVGRTLTVTLSIAPGMGGAATLALVTPASARPTPAGAAEPPEVATQTIALDGETAVFTLPIPAEVPAGLYVPRFTIDDARPLTPSGVTRGDLFLRPIEIMTSETLRVANTDNGRRSSAHSGFLDVQAINMTMRDDTTLDGQFAWFTSRPFGGRYQVSWRLQNGDGLVLSQLDTQPGYGFQPTDGWAPAAPVNDWLALRLPEELSGPPPYPLVMLLYDATTGGQLLTRRVGEIVAIDGQLTPQPVEPVYAAPVGIATMDVVFAESERPLIRFLGYDLPGGDQVQAADTLDLTLYWQAMAEIPADFARFVHLLDASGAVVTQIDGHPAGNSYPTGQWLEEEVVADIVRLDLSAVLPGEYRLAVGFYRPVDGLPRLDALAPEGPLPDGRVILAETVVLPER